MNQVPSMQPIYPVQATGYVTPQHPNYNAVKIDIHNPSVGVPGMAPAAQPQPQTQAQYQPITAPIYNYPQAPIYAPAPQQQAQPYPYQPMMQPQYQTPPIQQQNINYPPAQQAPVQQPQQVQNEPQTQVPEPQVSNKPEVQEPQSVQPPFDLNGFIAKLADPSFEAQATAMEEIPEIVNKQPELATQLVDQKVFDALNKIVSFDSSKAEGPSQAQIDARQKMLKGEKVSDEDKKLADTLAPKELAERNKSYALFSIAILDKLYADEVKKLTNTTVPLTDLPEAVNVVNQLKDNPNPYVRASAIQSLTYMQDPEYKKDLTTLFTVATKDKDPEVANAAKNALEKLDQLDGNAQTAKTADINSAAPETAKTVDMNANNVAAKAA